jgi:hypothetical protein
LKRQEEVLPAAKLEQRRYKLHIFADIAAKKVKTCYGSS